MASAGCCGVSCDVQSHVAVLRSGALERLGRQISARFFSAVRLAATMSLVLKGSCTPRGKTPVEPHVAHGTSGRRSQ